MILGIDVGTGGTRAVLIDRAGRLLASFASEHAPIQSAHIGWAEQDPEDWGRAEHEAIAGGRAASELTCGRVRKARRGWEGVAASAYLGRPEDATAVRLADGKDRI